MTERTQATGLSSKQLKIIGLIAALVLALVALVLVPILQQAPEPGMGVNVPSMERVPTNEGQLTLEVQPEQEAEGSSDEGQGRPPSQPEP